MAVVLRDFDEAFVFAQQQADATGKRQAVLHHPVFDRWAVQPRERVDLWVRTGWIVEDDRFVPSARVVCSNRASAALADGLCERCAGNCGGTGECRWDW